MSAFSSSRTVSVSIACTRDAVTDFVSNPLNLPLWAKAFCQAVSKKGDDWLVETTQGESKIRFAPPNLFGVLDHYVTMPDGREVYAPMRAIAIGAGTEVLFTLLRLPEMSDGQFSDDIAMVERDLRTLKTVMENKIGPLHSHGNLL